MIKALSPSQRHTVDALLSRMSTEEMIGQTLCPIAWSFGQSPTGKKLTGHIDNLRRMIDKFHVGCAFLTYCNTTLAQAAAVRLWLGEIKQRGKSPVTLAGHFGCGV